MILIQEHLLFSSRIIIFGGFGPPPDDEVGVKGEWIADPGSVRFYNHGIEVSKSLVSGRILYHGIEGRLLFSPGGFS